MDALGTAGSVFALVAVIVGGFVIVKSTTSRTTIQSQKELIDTLLQGKEEQKQQIAELNEKHIESSKAIAGLQGQVDVLKNVPLKEISGDLKSISNGMNSLSKNQEAIVTLLKQKAPRKK